MANVLLPNSDRNQAGGRLDAGAVLEAVDFLGIKADIEIVYTAQLRTSGKHLIAKGGKHVIRLSTYIKGDQLGRTLWHEPAHAAQSERFDNFLRWHIAYSRESNCRGYLGNKFEVEAREA